MIITALIVFIVLPTMASAVLFFGIYVFGKAMIGE